MPIITVIGWMGARRVMSSRPAQAKLVRLCLINKNINKRARG
jgi:hypothetical protein